MDPVPANLLPPRAAIRPGSPEHERLALVAPSGFREYDARWLFGTEINLYGLQALGSGLGSLILRRLIRPHVVTGHDCGASFVFRAIERSRIASPHEVQLAWRTSFVRQGESRGLVIGKSPRESDFLRLGIRERLRFLAQPLRDHLKDHDVIWHINGN